MYDTGIFFITEKRVRKIQKEKKLVRKREKKREKN
jgi:hypothetical protein